MTNRSLSTDAVAQIFGVALLISVPTVSDIPKKLEFQPHKVAIPSSSILAAAEIPPSIVTYDMQLENSDRPTTSVEEVIGELRSWNLLSTNWDGEGAVAPSLHSLKESESFIRLLGENTITPEAMLLASGLSALYWNVENLYADLEFLGDGRIAYFIKCHEDKHKGVLAFDSQQMPAVFQALLQV